MTVPGTSTEASPLVVAGFEYRRVDVEGIAVNCAVAGSGAPLLLLHGYPENHLMWRDVAPVLARDHTVVLQTCAATAISASPLRMPPGWCTPSHPRRRDYGQQLRAHGPHRVWTR